MKTLKESLLDDIDILLQDTDLFNILAKSMPKKSDYNRDSNSDSMSYYKWSHDLFKNFIDYDTIVVWYLKNFSYIYVDFEMAHNKNIYKYGIYVNCDKDDSMDKKRETAYKILTIFKDNLNILSNYFKKIKKSGKDKIFSDINEFEKSFDKYKK